MPEVEDFQQLAHQFGQKCRREQQERLVELLARIELTAEKSKPVVAGLTQLKWTVAVPVLAKVWDRLEPTVRNIFLRGEWHGQKREQIVGACLSLSAAIHPIDVTSSRHLIEKALKEAGERSDRDEIPPSLKKAIERTWLRRDSKRKAAPWPFEALHWGDFKPSLQMTFLRAITESALAIKKATQSTKPMREVLRKKLEALRASMDEQDAEGNALDRLIERVDRSTIGTDRISQTTEPAKPKSEAPTKDTPSLETPERETLEADIVTNLLTTFAAALRELEQCVVSVFSAEEVPSSIEFNSTHKGMLGTSGLRGQLIAIRTQADRGQMAIQELHSERDSHSRQLAELRSELEEIRNRLADSETRVIELESQCEEYRMETDRLAAQRDEAREVAEELEQECQRLRERHVRQVTASREEERRTMGEQLASSVRSLVETLKQIERRPDATPNEKFAMDLARHVLVRIKSVGVPLEV